MSLRNNLAGRPGRRPAEELRPRTVTVLAHNFNASTVTPRAGSRNSKTKAAEIQAARKQLSMAAKKTKTEIQGSLTNAVHAAGHATMCLFLERPIASAYSGPPSTKHLANVQLCSVRLAVKPFSFDDAEEVSQTQKHRYRSFLAREKCLNWIMMWMAGESAQNHLEPHEGWADALLEKWKRENMADSKTLKAVTAEVWDRRYAAFTPDVARAMRLAQIVYPEKPKDEWWSQQAYELYKEACNLNDELFGNPRAWEAVELLRDALREEPELTGEKVASVIGQERLDYLQNLHKSVTWALRIGPRSSSHHMGIGGGNFALYLAGQAVVLSALRGVSDIDYIGGRGIPSPLRDGQMMYHGADPVHKGVEGFGLDLTHDIKRLAECLKSGDLHKAHELCVERVAFEMAGYAAENQKANSSYASKEIDIMPGWIRGLADVWNLSVLDIYAAPRESRAEPLVVLYGAVGRAMFLCRMIHRPADATAPWDQQTYKIFEEGCVRALGILMDDSGWRAVERLAYAIDKWHLLAGADVRRIIDGDDQTLAHLQEAFKSPN